MADEHYQMLDLPMNEVFDWSEDKTPLRDALWHHYMVENNKDTVATLAHLKTFEAMQPKDVKVETEKILR